MRAKAIVSIVVSAIFTVLGAGSAQAAADTVNALISKHSAKFNALYEELHRMPELSGEEKETAKKIATEMRALGLEVQEGIGGHGVVGVLRNGAGPTTWIRAELDALPVEEETGVKFKSQKAGKMHACGHDYHLTAILGVAQVMNESKADWKGTLVFVAQPAEEKALGAKAMLKDGLLKKVPKPDQLLSIHTVGVYKKGTVAIIGGYATANVDSVDVVFKGKGTHGSKPENGIDPFVMAAEFTLKMQTLLGREKPSDKPAVISVGSIHGGAKHNIIPDDARLQLTVRSYDPAVRAMIKKRIVEIARGIAKTNLAPEPEVSFPEDCDTMYNDPKLAQRMKQLLTEKLGKNAVIDAEPTMGGEDFGLFGVAAKAPSLMLWIGAQSEKDPTTSNHSPRYLPDFSKTAPLAIRSLSVGLLDLHRK